MFSLAEEPYSDYDVIHKKIPKKQKVFCLLMISRKDCYLKCLTHFYLGFVKSRCFTETDVYEITLLEQLISKGF